MSDEARKPGFPGGEDGHEDDLELAALAREDAADLVELDALYADVRAGIERDERAPGARLRTLSTARRRLVALVGLGLFGGVGSLVLAPASWAPRSSSEVVLSALILAGLMLLSAMLALRPVHRPALPGWTMPASVLGALVVLAGVYLLPGTRVANAAGIHALPCLGAGLAMGLPVYFLLRLLDRGGTPQAAAIALAAGLGGDLLLEVNCPVRAPLHLILGHMGVVVAFVVLHQSRVAARRALD